MGQFDGCYWYVPSSHPIYTSTLHNVATTSCRGHEYSDHVYSDARELSFCWESGEEVRYSGLEYMGDLPCDRRTAGDGVIHVHRL